MGTNGILECGFLPKNAHRTLLANSLGSSSKLNSMVGTSLPVPYLRLREKSIGVGVVKNVKASSKQVLETGSCPRGVAEGIVCSPAIP